LAIVFFLFATRRDADPCGCVRWCGSLAAHRQIAAMPQPAIKPISMSRLMFSRLFAKIAPQRRPSSRDRADAADFFFAHVLDLDARMNLGAMQQRVRTRAPIP